MRIRAMALALAGLCPAASSAQPAARPVVVELFTSQGCSSCPPADALVSELARSRPDLLPLTFHVTYWNRLGWHDPFSLPAATSRQQHYVAIGVSPDVYTPALVVDGRRDAVGSDRQAVMAAVTQARSEADVAAPVGIARSGQSISISVQRGDGRGSVLLIGYDSQHRTKIGSGENGGRTLLEANVVRSLSDAGHWTGDALHLQVPAPAGANLAVIVQAGDGRVLGAARLAGAAP